MADRKPLLPLDPKKFDHIRTKYKLDQTVFDHCCKEICVGASESQLDKFLYQCMKLSLDPLMNQIYFLPKWDKSGNFTPITVVGIEGLRSLADKTMQYAGNSQPTFYYVTEGSDKVQEGPVFPPTSTLIAASVKIYRYGPAPLDAAPVKEEFGYTAFLADYIQRYNDGGPTSTWKKFGIMLPKCAEAGGLRKAFPQQLGPLYIPEEITPDEEPLLASKQEAAKEEPKQEAKQEEAKVEPKKEEVKQEEKKEVAAKEMAKEILAVLREDYHEKADVNLKAYICKVSGAQSFDKVTPEIQKSMVKVLYTALKTHGAEHLRTLVMEKLFEKTEAVDATQQ